MPVFENTGIETRRVCRDLDWYDQDHSLGESSAAYIEAATSLCTRAAKAAITRAGLEPQDIDRIIYVNTTGLATPSIDARLVNLLGLRRNVRRTPVWGLGCAGGVAGLSHAYEHLVGHPEERVLLVSAEMCSLTLLRDDSSTSNVVATALFADGAAAAVLSGDETDEPGYRMLSTRSTLYPDSLDVMGWNVVSHGLQVVFDRSIPHIVKRYARAELDSFLCANGLSIDDVSEYLYHPGGPKVLEAYAAAYGHDRDRFEWSRATLREFGNMSSVTALYVLERYMNAHPSGRGGHAVISALGPGFASESILMEL
jgi:alkylresorcinol/alkylpyrone synthase